MKSQGEAKNIGKGRVVVGMSGGVDSSVSATLLKKAGYDVTGVFIKVWQPEWIECSWREDRLDAMRVCAMLDIPFLTLDLEKEYKREVVDYMVGEYRAGRTPNPDVMCNRYVKFGGFFDWAMKEEADFIATGHYAKIENGKLLMGEDQNKDQSYFLWTIRKEQLPHILFPVGNIEKPKVRKLAKRFGLPNAEKKDSQGLCFIGKIDIKEFLSHYIGGKRGDVLDEGGRVIGYHDGAFFYTIGERHGFVITDKTPNDEPYYVVKKNVEKNTITVVHKEMIRNGKREVELGNVNWINEKPERGKKYMARSRYRESLREVSISDENFVTFSEVQETLSPGQSLVFYDGKVCLGGGIIIS
ncbi:MAG: tRNA 2-thiouridine(34) synthase MnmA [bacterium]|nr:tRNA 2-thiouridine(34) synthase MnmA [bacterium]